VWHNSLNASLPDAVSLTQRNFPSGVARTVSKNRLDPGRTRAGLEAMPSTEPIGALGLEAGALAIVEKEGRI
jgi:hypothetical protein